MNGKEKRLSQGLRLQNGFSITEMLVSIGISAALMAGLAKEYSSSVSVYHDNQVRVATVLQAQAMLQTIGSELRVLGNGLPFEQANFQIGENTLSDQTVTEPIQVATATASHIAFRLNETGDVFLLAQDFDPASGTEVFLTDTSSLGVNDPIYISNGVVSGDDGLYATIASVDHNANSVTLAAGFVASPGALFAMGSVLEEVPIVTYNSAADGSGITRDSGYGPVVMGADSTLTLDYLHWNGSSLPLPLTRENLINHLRSVKVTIRRTSRNVLSTGQPFTAEVSQTYGIRNLNYVF